MSNDRISVPQLVLGSTSRYRKELLERLHLPFICQAPDVDETPRPDELPRELAERLALAKAQAVVSQLQGQGYEDMVVIGSDQVADLNGLPLGKPGDHARAMAQLQAMRGQMVVFHTAVAVIRPTTGFVGQSVSDVRVQCRADTTDAELDRYLRLDTPYDCAGSAKVESMGITLLDAVYSDDPTSLIGLPLIATTRLLRQAGVTLF